jgi:putative spermidine/putrescine transport system ATP-binding protein
MTDVSLRSLTKTFGGPPAVNQVSLDIRNGEFVSLLGPSGCGKTTTLKVVAGFEIADSGSIEFDGEDVSRLPAEKRDIGMVFQNYALFPHLTVAQNLAFGLEMRKTPRAEITRRVAQAMDTVQLVGLGERYPRQLSGGQQQRVALARALVIEPRILLLDEPLANLDARLRDEMRDFIRELQRRVGITTIYVTHDQAEALTMSDRIVVMFDGKVAQVGAPQDIYERPASRAVAEFVGRVNLLPATVVETGPGTCCVQTFIGKVVIAQATSAAVGQSVHVALRPEAISLLAVPDSAGAARVVSASYGGGLIDYRVEMAGGQTLHVHGLESFREQARDRYPVLQQVAQATHIADGQTRIFELAAQAVDVDLQRVGGHAAAAGDLAPICQFGIHLAKQINLQRGIDRDELRIVREHRP